MAATAGVDEWHVDAERVLLDRLDDARAQRDTAQRPRLLAVLLDAAIGVDARAPREKPGKRCPYPLAVLVEIGDAVLSGDIQPPADLRVAAS